MADKDPKDVLRTVDDEARRLAGDLIRQSRHGALAVLEPVTGVPLSSRVSVATAQNGDPVFLISQLSAHFGALEADPRASLMLGDPGRGDPLAHPRITVTGQARKTTGDERTAMRARFLARHPKAALYADFGDFAFWRLELERASLNGGFGKAYELGAADITCAAIQDLEAMEAEAVAHMNEDHLDAIQLYAQTGGGSGDGWTLATLDPAGMEMTRGDDVARLWFDPPLKSAEELRPRLVALAKRARQT
ncbi:MAG: HugZ family protein [Paracoccaceae bacterium]